jgi:hypothetical protein
LLKPEIPQFNWKISALLPRNLVIYVQPLDWDIPNLIFTGNKYVTYQPLHAILHTSSASRRIGLQYFELALGTQQHLPHGINVSISPNLVYVNRISDRSIPVNYFDGTGDLFCGCTKVQHGLRDALQIVPSLPIGIREAGA